jgi:hypothetical protein
MADFFVSYTSADRTWAEWIAFVLEEVGFSVIIQVWDFRPGSNFVLEMQQAASEAERTIMVLSPDYLKSQFASSEWAAAFSGDPQGLKRKLVPIMVRRCDPPGPLSPLVHISLLGKDEDQARELVLNGVKAARAKPARRPDFPGGNAKLAQKAFPGSESVPRPYMPSVKHAITDADKRRYARDTFNTIKEHFERGAHDLNVLREGIEADFCLNTATEFSTEVFANGESRCRCRIWQGGMHSPEGISYAEGHTVLSSNACNEILSIADYGGELRVTSLMGVGLGYAERQFDLKNMTQAQAADYLWRRFLAPLDR